MFGNKTLSLKNVLIKPPTNFSTSGMHAHPTLAEYYTNLTPFVTLSMFIGVLIVILNFSIFLTTSSSLKKHLNRPFLWPSRILCSFYSIISLAALTTLLVPEAWLICHTVMHISFTVGAIIFRHLCFQYVNSEANYLKESPGTAVAINTPPCFCCCPCLPAIIPSRGKFAVLRIMVWQMIFVQGSIMLVLNVIYYKDLAFYNDVWLYFLPFIICSIIIGMWGLNITVRIINNLNAEFGLVKKLFSLQLIMLLCKAQYLILNSQLNSVSLGQDYPMNHVIYKQTIINLLILMEMVLVSLFAQNAYKTPVQIIDDDNLTNFKL